MHYFFVTIQYYHDGNIVTFSTTIKSEDYPTRIEIIELAFIEEHARTCYLGLGRVYDTVNDSKTKIISYSNLTKQQYENYKIEKNNKMQ